MKSTLAGAF